MGKYIAQDGYKVNNVIIEEVKIMTMEDDKIDAYHEAGHAVMAIHKKVEFYIIAIGIPDSVSENVAGGIYLKTIPSRKKYGLILLAGKASVNILLNGQADNNDDIKCQDDLKKFKSLWKTKNAQDKNYNIIYSECIKFFKDKTIQKQVTKVAETLLNANKKRLLYGEVEMCIESVNDKK